MEVKSTKITLHGQFLGMQSFNDANILQSLTRFETVETHWYVNGILDVLLSHSGNNGVNRQI